MSIFGSSEILILILLHIILLIPTFAVATRRLHDINKTGWWQLLFLTIIGIIPLIYWLAKKGNLQTNRYGQASNSMGFWQSVRTRILSKYATFSGRATKSEFWYFSLFQLTISFILCFFIFLLIFAKIYSSRTSF